MSLNPCFETVSTPPPSPLPEAERGSRRSFSPSPLRGGGWGEGFFARPKSAAGLGGAVVVVHHGLVQGLVRRLVAAARRRELQPFLGHVLHQVAHVAALGRPLLAGVVADIG